MTGVSWRHSLKIINYFIGEMRLLKGDHPGARDFFQKSVATDVKDYHEYQFARARLARGSAIK